MDTDEQTLLRIRNLIRHGLETSLEIIEEDKSATAEEESGNPSESRRLLISRRQLPVTQSIPRISLNGIKITRKLTVHRPLRKYREIQKRLMFEHAHRMLLSRQNRSIRLLSITGPLNSKDSSPFPSLHAARQIFDGLPVIRPITIAEENIQSIENMQHNELLVNMAAMNIEESTSTSD